MKLVSTRLKPVVWLLATSSLILPNDVDWAVRPLTAVLIAPNKDILRNSELVGRLNSRKRANNEVTDFAGIGAEAPRHNLQV